MYIRTVAAVSCAKRRRILRKTVLCGSLVRALIILDRPVTHHDSVLCNVFTEVIATTTLVGTGAEAGADEDDFHTFRRKNLELTKEEKAEERMKKQQALKVGAHSGVVKAFGRPIQKLQKVVTF